VQKHHRCFSQKGLRMSGQIHESNAPHLYRQGHDQLGRAAAERRAAFLYQLSPKHIAMNDPGHLGQDGLRHWQKGCMVRDGGG
jgi:hypothetical protein